MKNSLKGFNSKLELSEERISKLGNKLLIEIIHLMKRIKKKWTGPQRPIGYLQAYQHIPNRNPRRKR